MKEEVTAFAAKVILRVEVLKLTQPNKSTLRCHEHIFSYMYVVYGS